MTLSFDSISCFNVIDEEAATYDDVTSDSVITLRAIQSDSQKRSIKIRLADSDSQISSARNLINKMYAWRGYGSDHNLASDPVHTTFTAASEDEVIGTITLAVDSPAGLAVDKTFPEEMERLRSSGAKLCELTKLAFDANASSKPLLAALFHVVFIYGQNKYGCTDLLIEVNPRHVRFYESMLGFKRIGELKTNDSVAAPSQLMWLKVAEIGAQIAAHTVEPRATSSRSLYPFFLSKREQRQVYTRLAAKYAWDMRPGAWSMSHQHDAHAPHPAKAAPQFPLWMSTAALGMPGLAAAQRHASS